MIDIWNQFLLSSLKYTLLFGLPLIPMILWINREHKIVKLLRNCGIINKDKKLPKLLHKDLKRYGYDMVFSLPAGICLSDFEKQQQEINQYLQAEVQFAYRNGKIVAKVKTGKLKDRYDYEPKKLNSTTLLIGQSRDGLLTLTLNDESPHLLIAGMTGSGKSMLLRTMIVNLILTSKNIKIHLSDLKGGAEFGIYELSSAITSFTKDINDTLKLLETLDKEMMKRFALFKRAEVVNIDEYNKSHKPLSKHILFIDEFANIIEEDKDCLKYLKRLLRMARACGIHIVLCTQRPDAQTVPGSIKNNVGAVIALKCNEPVNSRIILNNDKAYYLTGNGHGILHTNGDMEFRGFFLQTERAKKLIKHTFNKKIEKANIDDTIGVIPYADYTKRSTNN